MNLILRYAARSDRGLVRANNEDSVYAGARLLALADGMGGHAAGEVASQLVIAALAHLDDDEPGEDLLSKLNNAVYEGNSTIAAHVEADPDLEGMGTTLTAILFAGHRLGLVHIGDSRAYLLRDGELTQITKDDTFVQTLVDEGRITAEEAHSHPQRSLIMRALTGHEVEPTLTLREAREGDRYLLCSDGLSDPVSQDTILEALKISDVTQSADRLIELALRGGGPDNVTVVVADVVNHDFGGQTQPILAGAVSGNTDDAAPPDTSAGRASAITSRPQAATRAAVKSGLNLTHRLAHLHADSSQDRPTRTSRRRIIIAIIVAGLVVLGGLFVTRGVIRNNYYVGAYDGTVAIMQGIQGSVIGVRLQQPFLLGCLGNHNQLSQISYDQQNQQLDCQLMQLNDLRPSERELVSAGLPTGNLDDAINQLRDLATRSLLPQCAATPTTPATAKPATGTTPSPKMSSPAAPPRSTITNLPEPQEIPGTDCRGAL